MVTLLVCVACARTASKSSTARGRDPVLTLSLQITAALQLSPSLAYD